VLRCASILLTLLTIPLSAQADDDGHGRHRIEVGVGGGMSWLSDAPEDLDLQVGGQLSARAMVDLIHVRGEAWAMIPDPSRPDLFQLRGDARLLFVTVHDFTWRRSDSGELFRLMAGLGGEIDLPEDVGHLMLNLGFAMTRLGSFDGVERPFSEAYGGYAGVTARLHFWEIRNELRVAVHGMMPPPELTLDLAFSPEQILAGLQFGVTASNRLYIQALREGVVSLGPELMIQYEHLVEGPAIVATLGLSGTLGI